MHPDRLGSGSKGKCIYCENSEDKWFTPREFEKYGGRETSKDWKRSVKIEGKPFYVFINSGELKIHAFNCYCQVCIEQDQGENSEPGPIKFFSPSNRKRKADDETMPSMAHMTKIQPHPSSSGAEYDMTQLLCLISQTFDSTNSNNTDGTDEPETSNEETLKTMEALGSVPAVTSATVPNNDSTPSTSTPQQFVFQRTVQSSLEQITSKANLIENSIANLNGLLSSIKTELSSLNQFVEESVRNDNSLLDSGSSSRNDVSTSPNNRNCDLNSGCANCNRVAPFKCGRCNLVRYCSEFCQQKDWPIHNKKCGIKMAKIMTSQNKTDVSHKKKAVIIEEIEDDDDDDDDTAAVVKEEFEEVIPIDAPCVILSDDNTDNNIAVDEKVSVT